MSELELALDPAADDGEIELVDGELVTSARPGEALPLLPAAYPRRLIAVRHGLEQALAPGDRELAVDRRVRSAA